MSTLIERLAHPRILLAMIGVTLALMGSAFAAWAVLRADIGEAVCRNHHAIERLIASPSSVDEDTLAALNLTGPGADALLERIAARRAAQLESLGPPPSNCRKDTAP